MACERLKLLLFSARMSQISGIVLADKISLKNQRMGFAK